MMLWWRKMSPCQADGGATLEQALFVVLCGQQHEWQNGRESLKPGLERWWYSVITRPIDSIVDAHRQQVALQE